MSTPSNPPTDITLVLDRSGSIESIQGFIIDGVNAFVAEQSRLPGRTRITLARFDHHYELVWDNIPLPEAVPLTAESLEPRGRTALWDALGKAIEDAKARFEARQDLDQPAKVIIAVFTDGLENASRRFSQPQISNLVRQRREQDGWEFIFVGANQDAVLEAKRLGIDPDLAHSFEATAQGTAGALRSLSSSVTEVRRRRSRRPAPKSRPEGPPPSGQKDAGTPEAGRGSRKSDTPSTNL